MEVVANVTETCDKEGGQKLLLKRSYIQMDILINHMMYMEKTQREKCCKSRKTSENPPEELTEVQC
jgi:hypothetical protein